MFVNLHDMAAAEFEREVSEEAARLLNAGKASSMLEAANKARATVQARRGEPPTIAKAIHDLGGPLAGQE